MVRGFEPVKVLSERLHISLAPQHGCDVAGVLSGWPCVQDSWLL